MMSLIQTQIGGPVKMKEGVSDGGGKAKTTENDRRQWYALYKESCKGLSIKRTFSTGIRVCLLCVYQYVISGSSRTLGNFKKKLRGTLPPTTPSFRVES